MGLTDSRPVASKPGGDPALPPASLGVELASDVAQRMRSFLTTHPNRGGRYRFADADLDAAALRERSRAYQDSLGVASEEDAVLAG